MNTEVMRPELAGAIQSALATIGFGLQFLRQFCKIKDSFTLTLGIAVAVGLWALGIRWTAVTDWQAFIVGAIPAAGGCVSALLGGVFGTEYIADRIAARKPEWVEHAALPTTDSK